MDDEVKRALLVILRLQAAFLLCLIALASCGLFDAP